MNFRIFTQNDAKIASTIRILIFYLVFWMRDYQVDFFKLFFGCLSFNIRQSKFY